MNETLIGYVGKLMELTNSGNLNWERVEDTSCLTCEYDNNGFIICRYAFASGKNVISFNFLDKNNSVPNDQFFNWQETDKDFDKLNELYDSALKTISVTA